MSSRFTKELESNSGRNDVVVQVIYPGCDGLL